MNACNESIQAVYDFNNTEMEYPQNITVNRLFEEQASNNPGSTALVFKNRILTYSELNHSANRLARLLRDNGAKPGRIVGIMVERSPEMIIGIMAILKAGCAYLPIDPEYPAERIKYMLDDSGSDILISQSHLIDKVGIDEEGIKVVDIGDKLLSGIDSSNFDAANTESDIAYVIYTSGSTGKPKGVMLAHRSVINFIYGMAAQIDFSPRKTILALTTISFDIFVLETLLPLCIGMKIVIADELEQKDAALLSRLIMQHGVEMLQITPSRMQLLMSNEECLTCFANLKDIMIGGEAFPVKLLDRLKRLTEARIYNMYGPTETTVWSSVKELTDSENITIGKPIANTQMYILDENYIPLPAGEAGELYISGDGLAVGYLNRPELTEERFMQNPFIKGGRMYRTGDLARWLQNGEIECLGRVDNQVKIRGYRVELGDIEASLSAHKSIDEAAVTAVEDGNGFKFLCAYIVSKSELKVSELREYLLRKLPEYMVPSKFIRLNEMPLTPNGKIDRKSLPKDIAAMDTGAEYIASATPTQHKLIQLLKEILQLQGRISIIDKFLDLGGHSLKAAIFASRILKEFGVSVQISDIFKYQTVKALAEFIDNSTKRNFAPIRPSDEKTFYPVSAAQKRMFLLDRIEDAGTSYNVPTAMLIEGEPDIRRLENALRVLIGRYEILRTSFEFQNGEVVQKVHKSISSQINYFEAGEDAVEGLIEGFISRFDLSEPPLFRTGLFKITNQKYIFIIDLHHIISDGISAEILIKELFDLYSGEKLEEPELQYRDYVFWHSEILESDILKKQEQYWLEKFKGSIPVLDMPLDYKRPSVQSFQGDRLFFNAPENLVSGLKKLASEHESTLFMVLLAVFNIMLSKYSGQEEIAVATPIAGRGHADIEKMPGMFVNTLLLKNQPSGEMTFKEFLDNIKANALQAYDNQEYQFEKLIEKLDFKRDLSRNPMFDVMFILQNMDGQETKADNLRLSPYPVRNKASKFDLTLEAAESGSELTLSLEYCTKLFKRGTIERFAGYILNIAVQVLNNPGKKIMDLEMLTPEEKNKLLFEFNNSETEYDIDKTVNELFEEQAAKTPEKTALEYKETSLTYRELNENSNRLARTLRKSGVKAGSIVGILLKRSPAMITAIMGVLKAGGAYLPLDPEYPEDRIRYMLEDSKAGILLTQECFLGMGLSENAQIINVEDESIYEAEASNLERINTSFDLAYVIYTSGSTGKPKGVMIEHRAVNNFIKGMTDKIDFCSQKNILALTTVSFDIFVLETLLPLSKGLKIVMADETSQRDSKLLAKLINKAGIDILQVTPSRMQLIKEGGVRFSDLKSIKLLIIGGEPLPESLLKELKRELPVRIYNVYGPTETTVWSTVKELTGKDMITIGGPISNTRVYITDRNNKLSPIGAYGELCIAGDGLARGYLGRPELTGERFVPDPFCNEYGSTKIKSTLMYKTGDIARWLPDGDLEHKGRSDHQVKIRGYRIELGEIENVMSEYDEIKDCVVSAKTSSTGDRYLAGYYVSDAEIPVSDIRTHIMGKLPGYMVPEAFVHMAKLPLTPNGKIDRNALPEPGSSRPKLKTSYKAPETQVEKKLVEIWKQILKRDKIGVDDSFFELGGNSMLLVSMSEQLEKVYPNKTSVTDLFIHPTISKLAKFIEERHEMGFKATDVFYLKLPDEYFTGKTKVKQSASLKFEAGAETYKGISSLASDYDLEVYDILLSMYIYLLGEISGLQEIAVQTSAAKRKILQLKIDLTGIEDIPSFFRLVNQKMGSPRKEDMYSTDMLGKMIINRDENAIIPFFGRKSIMNSEALNEYDLAFSINDFCPGLNFTCEYNSGKLRKDKVEKFIYGYLKLLKMLSEKNM